MLMIEMANDRAYHAEERLEACRNMLTEAIAERDAERRRNARLGAQLWRADSLHLCAGQEHRCYTTQGAIREVLVDAGEGDYA